ncbi:MAG: DUF6644 family protein [Pseudomonadota bacterium]|nr:DUF6644 family protein [Pseudomonadota bacterium]
MLENFTRLIAESELRESVIWMLMNVPGLPPILQSIHILAVAALVGTVCLTQLRILGVAVRIQDPSEMVRRNLPWFVWSVVIALTSGIAFVIARPARYFLNPVAHWKFFCLTLAIALTVFLFSRERKWPGFCKTHVWLARAFAIAGLLAWAGVIFAGRWIAYVDYLFWE